MIIPEDKNKILKEKVLKIIAFISLKGGVGKTTSLLLLAAELASKGYKVALADKDHQCNLTHFFGIYPEKGTIANIYTGGKVDIVPVAPNIDLIPGSMRLDEIERQLETNPNKNMFFYDWLDTNYQAIGLDEYDYLLIDCRPDFGIATKNAIAVSHAVICPVTPSDFAYEGKENLRLRLDAYRQEEIIRPSRESLITAELFFLPNMVKHNTKKSRELMTALAEEENVLSPIPHKELFNRATKDNTIIDMKNNPETYRSHRAFFNALQGSLDSIIKTIDQVA